MLKRFDVWHLVTLYPPSQVKQRLPKRNNPCLKWWLHVNNKKNLWDENIKRAFSHLTDQTYLSCLQWMWNVVIFKVTNSLKEKVFKASQHSFLFDYFKFLQPCKSSYEAWIIINHLCQIIFSSEVLVCSKPEPFRRLAENKQFLLDFTLGPQQKLAPHFIVKHQNFMMSTHTLALIRTGWAKKLRGWIYSSHRFWDN